MEGSQLRTIVQQMIRKEINDMATIQGNAFPEQGVVQSVNADGSVNVQTSSGVYPNCGTPQMRVIGEQIVLITAGGKKVAI